MKKYSQLLKVSCCVAAITAAACVAARAQNGRFYFQVGAGAMLTSDTDLKSFFGEPLSPGSKVRFDPGGGYSLTAGYRFTDWFSLEGQTALMANGIHSMTGASRTDAIFCNVPFLVNVRFQPPGSSRVTPYIGGGVGGSALAINIDQIDLGGTSITGDESDLVFAYQGFAGLRFALNDRMGLGVEYRYIGAGEPSWEARNISGNIRFGSIQTHAISVVFDMKF